MYSMIDATSTITIADDKTLRQIWRRYDVPTKMLIGRVVVKKPLTTPQLRRLSAHLRRLVA